MPPPLPPKEGRKKAQTAPRASGRKASASAATSPASARKASATGAPSPASVRKQPKQTATAMKGTRPPAKREAKPPAGQQQKGAEPASGQSPKQGGKRRPKTARTPKTVAKPAVPASAPPAAKSLAALSGIQKMRRQVQLIRLVERMKRSAAKSQEQKATAEPARGLTTLHVGGLDGELEDEDRLQAVFGKFGEVLCATLRYKHTVKDGQEHVSWALLSFSNGADAQKALDGTAELSKQYEGLVTREVDEIQALQSTGAMGEVSAIHMEKLRELFPDSEEEEEIPQRTVESEKARIGELNYEDVTHIHVGGLEGELEDELLLQQVFGDFGTVVAVTLRYRRAVKDGKQVVSWALVSFSKPTGARKALDGTAALSQQFPGLVTRELDEMQALQSTGAMGDTTQEHMEKIREFLTDSEDDEDDGTINRYSSDTEEDGFARDPDYDDDGVNETREGTDEKGQQRQQEHEHTETESRKQQEQAQTMTESEEAPVVAEADLYSLKVKTADADARAGQGEGKHEHDAVAASTKGRDEVNSARVAEANAEATVGPNASSLLREGSVQKWKDGTWKPRHLELTTGPVLIYRSKKGKRELGRLQAVVDVGPVFEDAELPPGSEPSAVFEVRAANGEVGRFATGDRPDCDSWIGAIRSLLAAAPQDATRPVDSGFSKFDADKDGVLNASEMRQAFSQLFPNEQWDAELWPDTCAEFGVDASRGFDPAAFVKFRNAMESLHGLPSEAVAKVDDSQLQSSKVEAGVEAEAKRADEEKAKAGAEAAAAAAAKRADEEKAKAEAEAAAAAAAAAAKRADEEKAKAKAEAAAAAAAKRAEAEKAKAEVAAAAKRAQAEKAKAEVAVAAEHEPEPEPEELPSEEFSAAVVKVPLVHDEPSAPSTAPRSPMSKPNDSPAIGLRLAQAQQKTEHLVQDDQPNTPPKRQVPGLKLDLTDTVRSHEPTTPLRPGTPQQLMMGTPRTPRGSIPYETDLLREQLEEQLLLTAALREQLDASSAEAGVKQLRENWLLAEDRADRQRARLTEICLQQIPSLKRELAARNRENSVLTQQVSELLDELEETTGLGRELVMASPRQQDINSMQQRIEEEMTAKQQMQERFALQMEEKNEDLRKLHITLAKGEEEKAELRSRLTDLCAQQLPGLKQKLAEKDHMLEALQADRDEIGSRATQLITVYLPDMKRKLDASEREKEELQKQVTELQADLKEQQRIGLQAETDSAKMAGLLDQIESLKEERTELKAQVSQLRNETARLDSDHRAVVAETTRLKTANASLQQQHARLEQETSIARSSLAQEHAVEMARRSALSEQELHELTEQWKGDVATRDERIASTEAIAQDLQSLLSESHTRSEMLEAQAQELAAESEEMMTGLKTAHRAEISELQGSLEDSLLARQVLEERIASGESEGALLRNAVEEMRRQLQVAAMKHQGEEESWVLKQQEYDAKTEREARRSAALEKRVASLQQEVTNLGKSAASGDGLASPAVQASRQLTWYSEQLEATQNNARRLQRETDRVTRESRLLGEQLSDAKAEAKALRAEAKEAKDELRRLRAERQFSFAAGAEATASNPRSFSASSGTGTPTIGRQGAGLGTEFDNTMQRASRLREMAHSPVVQSSTSAPVAARPSGSRLGVPPVGVAPRRADAKGVSSGSPATNRSNEARDAGGGDSPATGNEKPPPSPLRAAPVGAGASQRGDKRPDEAWSDYYARRAAGN